MILKRIPLLHHLILLLPVPVPVPLPLPLPLPNRITGSARWSPALRIEDCSPTTTCLTSDPSLSLSIPFLFFQPNRVSGCCCIYPLFAHRLPVCGVRRPFAGPSQVKDQRLSGLASGRSKSSTVVTKCRDSSVAPLTRRTWSMGTAGLMRNHRPARHSSPHKRRTVFVGR